MMRHITHVDEAVRQVLGDFYLSERRKLQHRLVNIIRNLKQRAGHFLQWRLALQKFTEIRFDHPSDNFELLKLEVESFLIDEKAFELQTDGVGVRKFQPLQIVTLWQDRMKFWATTIQAELLNRLKRR